MLTAAAWCMVKLYSHDEKNEWYLAEAQRFAEKSLHILDTEHMDKKLMLDGDSEPIRRFNCNRILAEIAGYQHRQDDGEKYSKIAYDLASSKKEWKFEVLRDRTDFPWRDKVKAAQELRNFCDDSFKHKRLESHIFLAQAFFERGEPDDAKKAENVLFQVYEASNSKASAITDDDKERYSELLILCYKLSKMTLELKRCTEENNSAGQLRAHEHLGDLYNDARFLEVALRHYKKMKELAETEEEQRKALVSCAETSADLKRYNLAASYFDLLRQVENRMRKDTSETVASLFEMHLNAGKFQSKCDINREIDRLETSIRKKEWLRHVYVAAGKYYEKKGDAGEAERYKDLANDLKVEQEEDDEEKTSDYEWEDDTYILEKMREKARMDAKKRALIKTAGKENSYGESKLIERAREGTLDEVRFLVEQGADVNRQDPGGWTPLSEAVAANKLDIVKYLLTKNADPNSKSKEGLTETNFDGGITPLMEACVNGFCEIARWLLSHPRAMQLVSVANRNGWSAADFMAHYINEARRGEESEAEFQQHLKQCREILEKIRQMQRKGGYPVRPGDPPLPQPKSNDTARFAAEKAATRRAARTERRRGAADNYKEAMEAIGSRSKIAGSETKREKKKQDDDDIYNASDDEPLLRPSSTTKKSRVVLVSSDSEDEDKRKEADNKEESRRRMTIDVNDLNYGLDVDEEERPTSSQSRRSVGASQPKKKLTGVERLLLSKKKGMKRTVERGDENGVSIVPDDFEIEEIPVTEIKRRRNESESSQSESPSVQQFEQRRLLSPSIFREHNGSGTISNATSPVSHRRASFGSAASLSSASALAALTWVKVTIVREGSAAGQAIRGKAPSDALVSDLPQHIGRLKEELNGAKVDYLLGGDILDSVMTISDVKEMAEMCGVSAQSMVEIECKVKKTLNN